MNEEQLCDFCGIEATRTIAAGSSVRLCNNTACELAMRDEINFLIQLEADLKKSEGAVPNV